MANMATTDVLFVTLTQNGRHLANVCICGASSMNDVVRRVRGAVPGAAGMTRLSLRNSTRGWSADHSVFFKQ